MKHECTECDCDHESERHWRREWLLHRNNEVRLEAENQWDLLRNRRGRVDGSVAGLGAPTVLRNVPAFSPNTILFHPFSPEVVVAGQSSVSVWNSLNSRRISLIDVHERKSGVASPSVTRYIRLWDAAQELRKSDLATGTDATLTRLTFGPSHLGLFCAGFADGSVRLFDIRSPDSRVMTFDSQSSPILDCRVKGEEQQLPVLVAGDASGAVHYYELRNTPSSMRSDSYLICFVMNI